MSRRGQSVVRFDARILRLATERRAVILCKQTFFIQLFPNPVLFDNPPDRQPFFARQHDLLAGFAVGNAVQFFKVFRQRITQLFFQFGEVCFARTFVQREIRFVSD